MSFKDRLLSVLNEKNIKPAELGWSVGISRMSISQWLGPEEFKPRGENLAKISRFLMVNSEWLMTGKGSQKLGEDVGVTRDKDSHQVRVVTIKFTEAARKFSIVPTGDNMATISLCSEVYEKGNYDLDKLFAIKVKGRAMEPSLYDGDWIIVNTADATPKNGVVFAIHEDGEVGIRRLLKIDNQWTMSSDNADKKVYKNKPMTKRNLILGRVVHKHSNHI